MSQTRSIVAGGTAAVLLLGVGTSILFAEPPRASGDIGGPVVVTAAPPTDPPAAASSAPPAGVVEPRTGSAPSTTHEGALPGGSHARPAVARTPVDAPGPPPAPTPGLSRSPSTDLPSPGHWAVDRRTVEHRTVDRQTAELRTTDGSSTAEQPTSAQATSTQATSTQATSAQPPSAQATDDAVRDETRTTATAGRSGAREPWQGWIPTPRRSDACGDRR